MTPQTLLDTYAGQSLLYAPSRERESLRGQCVQPVCFFVVANGLPVLWRDASEWWYSGLYPEAYDRIPNSATATPQPGDLIIWDRNLPNSGGAGHIAVCLKPLPGTGTFISVDSNWGGKTVRAVTHNYSYVIGWLRPKRANQPQPQQPQGGDEMITSADQAAKMYALLRPNGNTSQEEIDSTVGRRSYAQFVNDGQAEVAQRDANLRAQGARLDELQRTIDQLNQVITQLNADDAADEQAISAAHGEIARLTTELTTSHDQIKELQDSLLVTSTPVVEQPQPAAAPAPNWLVRLLNALFGKKR